MKEMQGTLRRLSRGIPTVEHVWYGGGAGSILVRAAEPAADQFTVAIEKVGERAISEKAAAGLFVRPS